MDGYIKMDFRKFLNGMYINEEVVMQMKESYSQNRMIKLESFLKPEGYKELFNLIKDIKGEKVKIADRYSYEELGDLSGVGKFFNSRDFSEFISKISGEVINGVNVNILGFKHRDYTLLHDSEDDREGMEFMFVFADKWKKEWGGYMTYTDNEAKSYIFEPEGNCFILIDKNGMGSFVKYINNLAKDERFILVWGKTQCF